MSGDDIPDHDCTKPFDCKDDCIKDGTECEHKMFLVQYPIYHCDDCCSGHSEIWKTKPGYPYTCGVEPCAEAGHECYTSTSLGAFPIPIPCEECCNGKYHCPHAHFYNGLEFESL